MLISKNPLFIVLKWDIHEIHSMWKTIFFLSWINCGKTFITHFSTKIMDIFLFSTMKMMEIRGKSWKLSTFSRNKVENYFFR